jgi:hypothetical protein
MAPGDHQLQPPYPLTHLERRALERGEWTLVWNQADERVYFFNPLTRQATRHLQPVLLASGTGGNATLPGRGLPLSAALPPVPPADTMESLRGALEKQSSELRTADALIRKLQQENLLMRYALLSQPSSSSSHRASSIAARLEEPPLLLCSKCQQTEVSPSLVLSSSLQAMSSDVMNVLIASPLKTLNIQPATHTQAVTAERPAPLLSHTPLTFHVDALSANVAPQPTSLSVPDHTSSSNGGGDHTTSASADRQRILLLERQLQSLTTVHLELLSHVQMQR